MDGLFRVVTRLSAIAVVLLVIAIGGVIFWNARIVFTTHSGTEFLFGSTWDPFAGIFGAAPAIFGTLVSTLFALFLAVPIGLAIAVFLVEIAPWWLARPLGAAIELLAAVPSIIFGMWGLFVFAPFLASTVQPWLGEHLGFIPLFQGPPMGIGLFTAGLILALMILPYITSVARDVILLTPPVLKESAFGVGATLWETIRYVTLPYGMKGIVGAVFLGLGRALGETMAVTFVIGNSHAISSSLFDPSISIAAALANEFNEAVNNPGHLGALFGLGLVLFLVSFIVQTLSYFWMRRLDGAKGRL